MERSLKMYFREKLSFSILGVILLLFLPSFALSSGYESPGLGAKATAMGGAFIGVADNWTAIYWNPAGLAEQKGTKIGLDLYLLNIENEDSDSVANPSGNNIQKARGDIFFAIYPNQQVPTVNEPDKFTKTKTESTSLLPSVGGYTQYRNLTIGFGLYTPVGDKTKWNDKIENNNANITVEYNTLIGLSVATICVAKKIDNKLSLGGGLNYLIFKNEKEAKKIYTSTISPPLNYDYKVKADGSGDGFEGIVGILYKPNEKLILGSVYRSGSKLDLEGSANVELSINPAYNGKSDLDAKFYHPATYGFGLSYEYTPKLTLACDWARTDWSTTKKEITYKTESALLKNEDESMNWKATQRFRLGAKYKKDETLTLLGGFYCDDASSPKEAQGITGVVDPKLNVFSIGASYEKGNMNSDVNMGYAFGDRKDGELKYEKKAIALMITFSYLF